MTAEEQIAAGFYVDELLWRGRPPSVTEPVAYHVVIGHERDDAFGGKRVDLGEMMTPLQAEEAGYDLATLREMIDLQLMDENTRLRRAATELHRMLAEQEATMAALRREVHNLREALSQRRDPIEIERLAP